MVSLAAFKSTTTTIHFKKNPNTAFGIRYANGSNLIVFNQGRKQDSLVPLYVKTTADSDKPNTKITLTPVEVIVTDSITINCECSEITIPVNVNSDGTLKLLTDHLQCQFPHQTTHNCTGGELNMTINQDSSTSYTITGSYYYP